MLFTPLPYGFRPVTLCFPPRYSMLSSAYPISQFPLFLVRRRFYAAVPVPISAPSSFVPVPISALPRSSPSPCSAIFSSFPISRARKY